MYHVDLPFLPCTIQSNVVLHTDRHQIPGGMIVKYAFAWHMVCENGRSACNEFNQVLISQFFWLTEVRILHVLTLPQLPRLVLLS